MDDILQKIETLYFEHIVDENGILDDEGEHNVPLEKNNNVRYTFIDTNIYGKRSDNEIKRLKCINDCMEILSLVHMFIYQNYDQCKPMYFLPEGHNIPEGYNLQYNHNIKDKHNDENILIENDAPPDGYSVSEDYSNNLEVHQLSDCLEEMEI